MVEEILTYRNWLRSKHCHQSNVLYSAKFTESDHEKVDRMLELHMKYYKKVEDTDYR